MCPSEIKKSYKKLSFPSLLNITSIPKNVEIFLNFALAVSILYKNKGKGLKNLTQEQREHLDFFISQMNKNRYSGALKENDG